MSKSTSDRARAEYEAAKVAAAKADAWLNEIGAVQEAHLSTEEQRFRQLCDAWAAYFSGESRKQPPMPTAASPQWRERNDEILMQVNVASEVKRRLDDAVFNAVGAIQLAERIESSQRVQ